jgi:hypothetical protein
MLPVISSMGWPPSRGCLGSLTIPPLVGRGYPIKILLKWFETPTRMTPAHVHMAEICFECLLRGGKWLWRQRHATPWLSGSDVRAHHTTECFRKSVT